MCGFFPPLFFFYTAARCTHCRRVETLPVHHVQGMPWTAQPCTASDSVHVLWVDLSKCFLTFSRAAGQFLQARRGVPAQVRKAVWNLYSRPHGSFDSASGCCADFGSLRGSLHCGRGKPASTLPPLRPASTLRPERPVEIWIFYISVQRAPNRHHEPAVQPSGGLPTSRIYGSPKVPTHV